MSENVSHIKDEAWICCVRACMLSETLPGISNTFKRNCEIDFYILTFEKQVEVESLSSTVTLLVSRSPSATLIIAAAPFAISVAICNGHNVQS